MAIHVIYTRPELLFPYQIQILDSPARFTVTEAATKVGKTASHIFWLYEQALNCKRNQSVWWVAPIFTQSKVAFNRLRNQVTNRKFFCVNETNLVLTMPNGAKIEFKSADKPDGLYGDDVYAAVFDEFTRAKEEAWWALRTTLTSTAGKCKFIGNVRGKKNWGYKLALDARGDLNVKNGGDYDYFKITAYDAATAGMKTKDGKPFMDEIESAERDLPAAVFKELYLAEATEDGANPFGYSFISQCTGAMSAESPVCFGIDLAKTSDWTVIIGLDRLRRVCYFERFQKDWRQTTDAIISLPRNVPACIDSTGVGDPIVEDIQRIRPGVEAFKFSQTSKQQIMEGLAMAIQQKLIQFPEETAKMDSTDPGNIKAELKEFEFEYTRTGVRYSAPDGKHDDCVCALALANKIWRASEGVGVYAVY